MSEENVEIVRSWFERWNRGERLIRDELDPGVEIISRFRAAPYRGVDEYRQWTAEIDEQFQEWRIEIVELLDAGDAVVALVRVHMKGHGSGIEFDQQSALVVEIRKGKLRRMRFFPQAHEALKAAGLSE